MKKSKSETLKIIMGFQKKWETISIQIVEQRRWACQYEGIFLHKETGKYYCLYWEVEDPVRKEKILSKPYNTRFRYKEPEKKFSCEFTEVEDCNG